MQKIKIISQLKFRVTLLLSIFTSELFKVHNAKSHWKIRTLLAYYKIQHQQGGFFVVGVNEAEIIKPPSNDQWVSGFLVSQNFEFPGFVFAKFGLFTRSHYFWEIINSPFH